MNTTHTSSPAALLDDDVSMLTLLFPALLLDEVKRGDKGDEVRRMTEGQRETSAPAE